MRIERLEIRRVVLPLSRPYDIAYGSFDHAVNIFLRLDTTTGLSGYGCAAPDPEVTGETPESVIIALEGPIRQCVLGADSTRITRVLEAVRKCAPEARSARAAVDMALHDLLARKAGLPLWRMLGGWRESIPTSITIGIRPVEETLIEAREYLGRGFRALKIKGGLSVDEDVERVLRVRELAGPELELRFDANQGFTSAEALVFIERTRSARLELIEQPTPKDELAALARVTAGAPIPVMADESLLSLADSLKIAAEGLADMINIKLMKTGGIDSALQVNAVARSAGLEAMVGCMDEAALGIAAGLHFALSRPNVMYADLDGHLDLLDDPSDGSVILRDGILYPNDTPGLGARIDW